MEDFDEEDQEVLQKYVDASLKAYPLTVEFCRKLQHAIGDMRTDAEKKRDKEEHERVKKSLERQRQDAIDAAYIQGAKDERERAEKSPHLFFVVKGDTPLESVSFTIKKHLTRAEFRDILASWGKFV